MVDGDDWALECSLSAPYSRAACQSAVGTVGLSLSLEDG